MMTVYNSEAIISKIYNDYTVIVRPEVESDAIDTVYAGQVHPPGDGLFPI